MRKMLIIILLTVFAFPAIAQYNFHHPDIFSILTPGPEKYYSEKEDRNKSSYPGLSRFYLDAGMSFISISGFNTLTSWVSPKALLPINSKLMFEIGGTFINSTYLGTDFAQGPSSDFIAFFRGIYSVNEKLTMYGQAARSLLIKNPVLDNSFESYTFGMEYFISPNFRIGASVTSTRGFDPFYYSSPYPYGNRPPFIPGLYR